MINEDTIDLLRECNSGTQMAVYSIDEILEKINSPKLKELLQKSKQTHENLGQRLHDLLNSYGDENKEPNIFARGMSWMKTNLKLTMENSDRTCADLMTEGYNMGVKSLQRYLNQYGAADETSKSIARELIAEEEQLTKELKEYL